MYERKFGLQRRPFLAKVSQSDVFVGPQTAQTMASLRKSLQVQDAIVAVTGPAGSGKSTLVGKAIEAVADTHAAVRIGRMSLRGTDILEFLLEELGATPVPAGPIRQFAALRERLRQFEADGRHVVVVVEDARRLGVETLAELEALTAADSGESAGAAVVVMGNENLKELLGDPELTRFAQRVRLRHTIVPLSDAEMRGYFIHCFRRAGGDFEQAFDNQAVGVIRSLSQGIPRMANNIAEASMSAAAAAGTIPVTAKLIAEVAFKEFGLEGAAAEPQPATEPEPVAAPATAAEPETPPARPSEPLAQQEPQPETATAPPEHDTPTLDPPDDAEADVVDEIPELIQDTLPDLEVLSPEIAMADAQVESTPEPEPETQAETQAPPALEPELELEPDEGTQTPHSPSAEAQEPVPLPEPQPAASEVPEWDRDPTLAELRPDFAALELAMAQVREESDDGKMPDPDDMPVLRPEPEVAAEEPEEIPEITLDNAINERIEDNLIDEPGSVSRSETAPGSAAADPVPTAEPGKAQEDRKKADAELERIASELARAKTLEDVDDKLAETLFGEELSLAAAEVAARVQAEQSANDEEIGLADTGAAQMARAVGSAVSENAPLDQAGTEIDIVAERSSHSGLDLSASQRLRTVRSLQNSSTIPPADSAASTTPEPAAPAPAAEPPASIEDQINTSMTQTLKALDVKPPTSSFTAADERDDDDDEEEAKKRGFFGRFRRS